MIERWRAASERESRSDNHWRRERSARSEITSALHT